MKSILRPKRGEWWEFWFWIVLWVMAMATAWATAPSHAARGAEVTAARYAPRATARPTTPPPYRPPTTPAKSRTRFAWPAGSIGSREDCCGWAKWSMSAPMGRHFSARPGPGHALNDRRPARQSHRGRITPRADDRSWRRRLGRARRYHRGREDYQSPLLVCRRHQRLRLRGRHRRVSRWCARGL